MDAKQRVGEFAADKVLDGMVVGLGTGSTVSWTIRRLGERVRRGLHIRGVATSRQTEILAKEVGIPLVAVSEVEEIDLTIDGADEVSPAFELIKGGGGALLREKLVAIASKRLIIVVDEMKLVPALGRFPLPVEIVPFAWALTLRRVERLAGAPVLRMVGANPFVTDNGNYILDVAYGRVESPGDLHGQLKALSGVVETGLFVGLADLVLVGSETGVRTLESAKTEGGP